MLNSSTKPALFGRIGYDPERSYRVSLPTLRLRMRRGVLRLNKIAFDKAHTFEEKENRLQHMLRLLEEVPELNLWGPHLGHDTVLAWAYSNRDALSDDLFVRLYWQVLLKEGYTDEYLSGLMSEDEETQIIPIQTLLKHGLETYQGKWKTSLLRLTTHRSVFPALISAIEQGQFPAFEPMNSFIDYGYAYSCVAYVGQDAVHPEYLEAYLNQGIHPHDITCPYPFGSALEYPSVHLLQSYALWAHYHSRVLRRSYPLMHVFPLSKGLKTRMLLDHGADPDYTAYIPYPTTRQEVQKGIEGVAKYGMELDAFVQQDLLDMHQALERYTLDTHLPTLDEANLDKARL